MTSLDIMINTKKLSLYSHSSKSTIDKETMLDLIGSFSEYIRYFYLRLIYEAIHSRRYKGNWEPVDDPGYIEYLGVTPCSNIYTLMTESLEVVKIGSNMMIRFDPSYKYPGSSKSLVKVLRAIDHGTSDFNSRPLFRKCVCTINNHIYDLWKGFLAMRGVI